jgi:hypothetical protein
MPKLRLKPQYLEEMILDLRKIIKENTYQMATIDIEAEVLAFSLKKLDEWLDENIMASEEEKMDMSRTIFHEASSAMMDCHPMYGEKNNFSLTSDTEREYEKAAEDMLSAYLTRSYCKGYVFYKEYYKRLYERSQSFNAMELMGILLN